MRWIDKKKRRMFRRWVLCAVAVLLAGFAVRPAECVAGISRAPQKEAASEEREDGFTGTLYAKSAVLMDGESGRVLYGKDERTPRPMASTTKIMTCIIALEQMDGENEIATVSDNAAKQPKVHLNVKQGQQFYLKDLLYSLMLESHNDSAVVIAEHVAGSMEKFAELMNEKARSLGCTSTHFVTPNGLDASDKGGMHATTAEELAKIMKYCVADSPKSEAFVKITGASQHTFQDVSGKETYTCNNHNAFLTMMDGAFSGKTGFTGDAGYCYVGALKRDGKLLIVALLACGWPNNKGYKWADTKALMAYGLEHYEKKDVWEDVNLPSLDVTGGVPNGGKPGNKSTIQVEVDDAPGQWEFLMRPGERMERKVWMKRSVKAPVRRGAHVGAVTYELNGVEYGRWNIVATSGKQRKDFAWCMRYVLQCYVKINQVK